MRAPHLLLLSLALAGPALAQHDALLRCRELGDASARLACYDAIALSPRAAAPAAQAAPLASPAPMPAAAKPEPTAGFGLEAREVAAGPQSVQSAVGPAFDGWLPNQRIRLDNGQVWQVTDGSSVSLRAGARKATVRRGLLGAFYLDIEGLNTSPRVRRTE